MQRAIAWQRQAPQQRWLMVQDVALPACVQRDRARPIGLANRRAWWLLPAAATAGCGG